VRSLAAVVPALDEEASIAEVVRGLLAAGACCVLVIDGGSSDATRERAAAAGAVVVREPRRGYGRACLTGAEEAQAGHRHDLIAFLDGDGSCDPGELPRLAERAAGADVVFGVRRAGRVEPGAYPWHARLGNRLATAVIRLRTGRRAGDLTPFKVLRAGALARLQLRQEGFAWTTELVARALADRGLVTAEVEIGFRARRGGASKVSGRLLPSARAGVQILRSAMAETRARPRLVLMAKAPGRAKSRLAAEAGEAVASGFWAASLRDVGARLLPAARDMGLEARVMLAGEDDVRPVGDMVGDAWIPNVQSRPGLGAALSEVFARSFAAGAPRTLAVSADNPTLPPRLLRDALDALRRADAVLGPNPDGGYYLVGLRRLPGRSASRALRRAFGVRLGGDSALEATRRGLREAGLRVALLDPWPDVDTLDDLRSLAATLVGSPAEAPATFGWLAGVDPGLLGAVVIRDQSSSHGGGVDVEHL
jgi:glycosyltransferase A (GT-A) superfamily protein (DUF2064 family)